MPASIVAPSHAAAPAYASVLRDAAPSYKYLPALDGIRAFSILTVIISHFGLADLVPGGFGVNVFFFISGLLISRQLSVELTAHGRISFVGFYLRRFARLVPALFVMIPIGALFYVAAGKTITPAEVFSALFYYSNYFGYFWGFHQPDPTIPHPFIILWSLAVEEHFYLFFPLLISLFFRTGRFYLAVLIVALIAIPSWRYQLHTMCAENLAAHPVCGITPTYRIYGGTDTRADSLLYGVLLTELLRHKSARRLLEMVARPAGVAVGCFLIILSLAVRSEEFRDVYRYSLQSLGMVPIVTSLIFSEYFGGARRVLESRPMVMIGRWSYSLYLYHWIAMTAAGGLVHREFSVAWYGIAVPLCAGLSLLSYYAVEMPFVGLRRRLGSHVVTRGTT